MNSITQLFLANLRILYRDKSGFFWTLAMPTFIYIALSVLPIGKFAGANFNYSNYVLPGIIAMSIMQAGIYGLAYWMTDLKARGVIKRFLVTPLKQWQLVIGLVASRLVVTIIQTIVLTLVGVLAFHASFAGNIVSTLLLVLLGGGIFLLVGLLVANVATSYQTAAPITSAIGLPLTFLGNIFYPTEGLPHILQLVAKALPITYLADGLRHTYLEPFAMQTVGFDITILTVWFIALLAITISVFRLKE